MGDVADETEFFHIQEDTSQMMRRLYSCMSWDDVRKFFHAHLDRTRASFPEMLSIEFAFYEHSPACRQPLSRNKRVLMENRKTPIVPYTDKQIDGKKLMDPSSPILDMERYIATPRLKERVRAFIYETLLAYPYAVTEECPVGEIILNGVNPRWTQGPTMDRVQKLNAEMLREANRSIKALRIVKPALRIDMPKEDILRTLSIHESDGIGEEDLKAVPFVMSKPKSSFMVRSIDGDLVLILLLCADRLVDKDSGFIESNVVLDLSGKWRPKDPTFTLQKKKATPKKRRMGTNDAAPVPVSDPEPVQMPFLLDVVVLWRSIILWMAKLQPSAPYAVHTFAVMALLGGNDYVRMDDSHMGFPGIGFRTIWNTFHASINVRRCLCSCVRVLDKDESGRGHAIRGAEMDLSRAAFREHPQDGPEQDLEEGIRPHQARPDERGEETEATGQSVRGASNENGKGEDARRSAQEDTCQRTGRVPVQDSTQDGPDDLGRTTGGKRDFEEFSSPKDWRDHGCPATCAVVLPVREDARSKGTQPCLGGGWRFVLGMEATHAWEPGDRGG